MDPIPNADPSPIVIAENWTSFIEDLRSLFRADSKADDANLQIRWVVRHCVVAFAQPVRYDTWKETHFTYAYGVGD